MYEDRDLRKRYHAMYAGEYPGGFASIFSAGDYDSFEEAKQAALDGLAKCESDPYWAAVDDRKEGVIYRVDELPDEDNQFKEET